MLVGTFEHKRILHPIGANYHKLPGALLGLQDFQGVHELMDLDHFLIWLVCPWRCVVDNRFNMSNGGAWTGQSYQEQPANCLGCDTNQERTVVAQ
jgi:hypothetical protein